MAASETLPANDRAPLGARRVIDEELIRYVADAIVERFHPKRIILFGSQARGDAGPDSDLDIFVEMETSERPAARMIAVDSIFRRRSWPMDIVVYTPEEAERMRQAKWSLLNTIEAEGKVLYLDDACQQLTAYAVSGRYPDVFDTDEGEARDAIAALERIRTRILPLIPPVENADLSADADVE